MTKSRLEAVIFDMDGVIADTMHYHYLANKKLADTLGVPFTENDNERYKGISRMDIVRDLLDRAGRPYTHEEALGFSERKNAHYQSLIDGLTEADVLGGILLFLGELKKANIKRAVASSSTNAERILKKLGVHQYFDYVVNAKEVTNGKPHPEIFLRAAEGLGVRPVNCLAIEDGEAGLRAIQETAMFAVGVGADPYMKAADVCLGSTSELRLELLQAAFANKKRHVIGVDGGGTYTRAVVVDETGATVASVKVNGGAHPGKDPNAKEHVQSALRNVLEQAAVDARAVSAVVCGLAGLNSADDLKWAREFTNMPGFRGKAIHVNDAVVSRKAAFGDGIGIVAIAGTGSIVMGFPEHGRMVRNYDFSHLAYAGARHLSLDVLHQLMAGEAKTEDARFLDDVLAYWGAASVAQLRELIMDATKAQTAEHTQRLSKMAPLVTAAAQQGSGIAASACQKAMANMALGVKLVAGEFKQPNSTVAVVGGVIQDPYMLELFTGKLAGMRVKKPLVDPAHGAVLLGFEELGMHISLNDLKENL